MNAKWLGHALVLLQIAGIGLACWGYIMATSPRLLFLIYSSAGFLLGIFTLLHNRPGNFSVHPIPLSDSSLITEGPYTLVRHPMYLSVILVLLGMALAANTTWSWIGLIAGSAAVIGKTFLEEPYLLNKHPEYEAYQKQVKRLIPFIW